MSNRFLIFIVLLYSFGVICIIFMHLKYMKLIKGLKKVKKEAYYDNKLGLISFSMFKSILMYIIDGTKENSKVVIMSLDLENLKELKRILGDVNGDLLLKESLTRIKSCIRSNDLVSLTDSRDFVFLFARITNYRDIELIAQRILSVFDEPFSLKGREFTLNVSLGIAVYPENGKDVELLLKNANSASHRAKKSGVNNFFFYNDDLNKQSKKYDIFVKDIRSGIYNGEFLLYYQPQYDIKTNKIVGVEALVRWNHPTKGIISPSDFIPVAESSGLIVPLGYYILREACKQYKQWGLPDLELSVNLSAYQFKQKDLVNKIKDIIIQEGIDPTKLNLEITESAFMSDINFTLKVLKELIDIGVQISIDDFGTGYSSLSYLKQFPITALKIDRSFVKDISKCEHDDVLLKMIINLAKNLRLKVVAEGVETKEQFKVLNDLSCDIVQGYLISEPLSSDKLPFIVKQRLFELDTV